MLHINHPFFPTFKRMISDLANINPVYDLGTSARFAKEVGLVRHLLDESSYYAGGYRPNFTLAENACDFDCDVQTLNNIQTESVGAILCLSVLEHVVNPIAALVSFLRVLQPGGVVVASVPFFVGYHGKTNRINAYSSEASFEIDSSHDGYSDFWRYTHEGLALIFLNAGFSKVEIYPIDGPIICRLELLGLYRFFAKIPYLCKFIHWLDRPKLGKITTMHFIKAIK